MKETLDSIVYDVVGHGFLLSSGLFGSIINNFDSPVVVTGALYSGVVGGILGGVYHYYGIDKLNKKFKKALECSIDKPKKLEKIDSIFEKEANGSLIGKYTNYLYQRQRNKIFNSYNISDFS